MLDPVTYKLALLALSQVDKEKVVKATAAVASLVAAGEGVPKLRRAAGMVARALENQPQGSNPSAPRSSHEASTRMSVQCRCGYEASGTQPTVVDDMQVHCQTHHGQFLSMQAILKHAQTKPGIAAMASPNPSLASLTEVIHQLSANTPSPDPSAATSQRAPATQQMPALKPVASLDISTRGFMESERVGEYFVILQVDNLRNTLLHVLGPGKIYAGYYNITSTPHSVRTTLVDDENTPVPVTFTRLANDSGSAVVRIEIWSEVQAALPTFAPYMPNPFK